MEGERDKGQQDRRSTDDTPGVRKHKDAPVQTITQIHKAPNIPIERLNKTHTHTHTRKHSSSILNLTLDSQETDLLPKHDVTTMDESLLVLITTRDESSEDKRVGRLPYRHNTFKFTCVIDGCDQTERTGNLSYNHIAKLNVSAKPQIR